MTEVLVHRDDEVVWARLDNPGRGNALAPVMVDQLREVVGALATDPGVRALVLTGTGRSFCGGADVRASAALGDTERRLEFLVSGRRLVEEIEDAPVPVIAAVNGPAFAGGLELVLACDVVIAAESAVFGDLHLAHGRIPGWGAAHRLVRRCGEQRAAELLLLVRRWDAPTALSRGLVTEVVPDQQLGLAVSEVLRGLGSADRRVTGELVALLRELRRTSPDQARELEWGHFVRHFTAGDPGVVRLR